MMADQWVAAMVALKAALKAASKVESWAVLRVAS